MRALRSIAFRYLGLAIQFFVTAAIARRLPQGDAGTYLMIFGWIATTYFLSGAGLPDGMVKFCLEDGAVSPEEVIRRVGRRVVGLNCLVLLPVALAATFFYPKEAVVAGAVWWIGYATVFFCAQAFISLGRVGLGTFFFYPAINLSLACTTLVYLVVARAPGLQAALELSAFGSLATSLAAVILLKRALGSNTGSTDVCVSMRPVFIQGLYVAIGRVGQTSLYWIPVWIVGLAAGVGDAGTVAVASRLAIACGGVIAAIRFSIRPELAEFWNARNILKLNGALRKSGNLALLVVGISIAANLLVGKYFISAIFGASYIEASFYLNIFLLSIAAECIGGAIDEFLKLIGWAKGVALTVFIAALSLALTSYVVAKWSWTAALMLQPIAFLAIYLYFLKVANVKYNVRRF